MPQLQQFAQKAIIMIKHSPTTKITGGYYALPGGRMDFGEEVDAHIIREVTEETGLIIEPGKPIAIRQWQIVKGAADIAESQVFELQIIAVYRLCQVKSGQLTSGNALAEEGIEALEWVDVAQVLDQVIPNEVSVLQTYLASKTESL
jgi:8-oxo-dGTP pyrophosphatase MutT (NUDIX family)